MVLSNDHKNQLRYNGKLYGYPDCCINEFIQLVTEKTILYDKANDLSTEELEEKLYDFNCTKYLNYKVSDNTGFIPCNYHTKQIFLYRLKLSDLIINRSNTKPNFQNYSCNYFYRLNDFNYDSTNIDLELIQTSLPLR